MLFSTPLNKPLRLTEALWGLKSCTEQQTQDQATCSAEDAFNPEPGAEQLITRKLQINSIQYLGTNWPQNLKPMTRNPNDGSWLARGKRNSTRPDGGYEKGSH